MKHLTFKTGALVAAALVISAPVQARDTAAQSVARRAITAQYARQSQALLNRNVPAMMATLAPDYVQHTSQGAALNRAQIENMMGTIFSGSMTGVPVRYTNVSFKILSITWRGPDAIVVCQSTVTAVSSQGGRTARVEGVGVSRDYWSPTHAGWQARQSVERESKMWINGKRFK